jgi:hypothetical protein
VPASRSPHPPPNLYEEPNAGGYGYSLNGQAASIPPSGAPQYAHPPRPQSSSSQLPLSSSSSHQLPRKSCECPMCYHSIRNPCGECGCPSNTVPKSARLNPTSTSAGRQPPPRTAFTDDQTALSFFSPSSDYYSLSPDSPPPLSGATTAAASNNSSPEPNPPAAASATTAAQMPIYAQVHKERSAGASSPAAARGLSPVEETPDPPRGSPARDSPQEIGVKPSASRGPPPPTARKPSLPARPAAPESTRAPAGGKDSPQDRSSNSRRHSWAGERKSAGGRPSGKPTSLQEFKRLLAQQTPGQNPHRVSAQELLKTAESGAASPLKSSGGSGGSLRKKTSPWRDNRFSVIQEEAEMDKSRENLLD